MAKVVKTVVLVAAAVALVAFAAPIAGFVAGTLSITAAATIASIATVVTSIGLTLGATAVMGLFRKTPSIPNATVERLNSSVVPAAPRKIVFGETAAGNDIRFAETSGSKKDRYDCVIALASHRISSVKAINFENNLAWQGEIQSKFSKGLIGVRHILEGKATNAISVGSGSYWNTTSTFTGCAYMALRYKLDGELWPEGIPQRITTIVEGCPLYDPRRDSNNGGTGPHRIADQNTWAFHADGVAIGRNPALALLAYLIGYRIAGKLVWGMGVPISRINFDSFRSYANLCEERVALQVGGTVQRYTCDGILSTADSHETCINAVTAAMGSCKLVDAGGQYSIIGGYDDTLGLKVHFTADDLVAPAGSTQPYVWVPAPPVRETYNTAKGKFADPASLYQLVEWGTIETEPLADGIERQMTVDLAMVSRPETCQRIASQFLLREAKTPGIFSAVFGPRAFSAQVGSLVTLSLPAQGWNRKLFRVLDQAESHDLVFQMTLREESSEVYAWDREEKPLPANIRPEGYDPADVLSVEGLAATTTTSIGASSYETSDISVMWFPQDSGRVAGIQIEARPVGMSVWSEVAALHNAAAGELAFQSVRPGAQIEIRARYRMSTAVYGPWSSVTINSAPAKVDWRDAISGEGKPEDGATVGAPVGTEVGGRPVEQVLQNIDQTKQSVVNLHRQLPNLVVPLLQKPIDDLAALNLRYNASQFKATTGLHKQNLVAIRNLTTRVEQDGSKVAEDILQLTSRLTEAETDILNIDVQGPIEAGLSELRQTIANANYASSEAVDTKIANYGTTVSAWQVEEERVRSEKDSALAESINTLSSNVNGFSGIIQTLQETQAEDNGARAAETKNLQSRLDNVNGASLEQTLTTFASKVDGIGASYVLKVQTDQNGQRYIAGMGVAIENGVSAIAFSADSFRLTTPGNTATQVFYADATGIYAPNLTVEKLKANSIDSTALKQAASSKTSYAIVENDVACNRDVATTVVSYQFWKEDDDSLLKVQMFAQCYNQDDLDFFGDIVLDGVSRQRAQVRMPFDNSNSRGQAPITPFAFLPNIPKGSHTISFTLLSNETEGPTYVRAGSTLEVTELRRASIGSATGSAPPVGGGGGGEWGGGGTYQP